MHVCGCVGSWSVASQKSAKTLRARYTRLKGGKVRQVAAPRNASATVREREINGGVGQEIGAGCRGMSFVSIRVIYEFQRNQERANC